MTSDCWSGISCDARACCALTLPTRGQLCWTAARGCAQQGKRKVVERTGDAAELGAAAGKAGGVALEHGHHLLPRHARQLLQLAGIVFPGKLRQRGAFDVSELDCHAQAGSGLKRGAKRFPLLMDAAPCLKLIRTMRTH